MANRRADYQKICERITSGKEAARSKALEELNSLILEDKDYASGFLEDTLRRALRFISPTVGRRGGRDFRLMVEVHDVAGRAEILLGASFKPNLGDDLEHLTEYFGEELEGLSKMKGFGYLIRHIAVNGSLIELEGELTG